MLRRVGVVLWFLSAAAIIGLAVALSSARVLLPAMSGYKVELEVLASRRLQHPVTIGSLSASWRGISPALSLRDLRIEDQRLQGGALQVGEVQIALDVWRSLLDWRWQTRLIDVSDLSVRLYRHADGTWSLFETPTPASNDDWLDTLFGQDRIGFRDARVTLVDQVRGGLTRVFRDAEFTLTNNGDRHRLSLALKLPGSLGRRLELAGDLRGNARQPGRWAGQLYLNVQRADLGEWADYFPERAVDPGGRADAELWMNWSDGHAQRVGGRLRVEALSLSAGSGGQPAYSADRLGGRFRWTRSEQGWDLEADDIELLRDGMDAHEPIAFHGDWHQQDHQLRLAANRFPLDDIQRVTRLLPGVRPAAQDWLDRLQPRGLCEDVELDARVADPQAPRIALNARFTGLSTSSFQHIPGISGVSGSVRGNLISGEVHLDTSDAVFDAPKLFRKPIAVSRLEGVLHWNQYPDRVRVDGDGIELVTADVATRTRLLLDWVGDQSVPWIDLQTAFDSASIAAVPTYLPVGIMPPKTVEWLDRALVSGHVSNARFTMQGPADRLPFRDREGTLLATFDFDGVTLAYHPEWGQLEQLQGHASFQNASMRITGESARILDNNVRRVVASIDNFFEPDLVIQGTVDGQLPAMTAYVRTTPLAGRFQGLLDAVRLGGDAGLQLDLDIPLKSSADTHTRIQGDLSLHNSTLAHKEGLFDLTDIDGDIRFTQSDVRADAVKARMDGAPVTIDIVPGDDRQTMITVAGSLDLVKRVRDFGRPIGAELEGRADTRIRVIFPGEAEPDQPPLRVKLESDLVGIGSQLPAPFGKLKDDAKAFSLQWVPGRTDRWPISVQYGDDVSARVLLDGQGRVRTGVVQFGGEPAKLPATRQFLISGHVAGVRPMPWGQLFAGAGEGSPAADAAARAAGVAPFPPLRFDLTVDQLSLFDYDIANVHLTSAETDPWHFHIDGKKTAGDLRLVFATGGGLAAVDAKLERLLLGVPDSKTLDAQKNRMRSFAPASMPRLSIDIGDLTWGNKTLGHFRLDTETVERGVDIKQLQLDSEALVADASGQWYLIQGQQSTRLSVDVKGGTLERLLRLFGDSQAIAGAPLAGSLHASWNGSPADFSLSGLQGEMRVELGEGRLVDVKPGAGKLLGLLSLQSLPRRLSLDFTDLFKKGFSFDRIKGDFQLTEMNAYTDNLHIDGPAADIYISGRTGLVQQDYDEVVTVVPHISASLPIAGAIAGGPAVGAAVLLAERLLGDQVNKMSKVEYRVTGSWADPRYERIEHKAAGGTSDNKKQFE